MSRISKMLIYLGLTAVGLYALMDYTAKHRTESPDIDNDNLYLNPDKLSDEPLKSSIESAALYESKVKPVLDKILSFAGLIVLSPVCIVISAAVYLDDPGPVFFMQKRVGKDKKFFELHKFRTMKLSAPHDVPTHQLTDPGQYITRVGKVLRRTSLDELPQIWDIFRGRMSIIGPRPALWNQGDLVAEREKYGANNLIPGLTGWAQINGRDKLEIPDKAKLDGEYTNQLKQGGLRAFFFDVKMFFRTIASVFHHDGVVEGETSSVISRKP